MVNETEQNPEERCPRCEMESVLVALSTARVACSGIKEDIERGTCMDWAAGIDPSEVKNAETLMEEIYNKTGIDGLARYPELYNKLIRKIIVKKVGEKLENGETITEEESKLYEKYTKQEIAKGL